MVTVLKPGHIIGGKYQLRRLIGSGAMATVWSGVHETLGRPVAVKCIHAADNREPEILARFMQEARNAAAVQHRYVIDIFDFGTTEQGEPFMVMELLQGETLADRLNWGPPMPLKSFIRLIDQCLSGLYAAHQQDIVHRDLKPENIFLVHDHDGGFPKILDFGISMITSPTFSHEKTDRLTKEGTIVGTPYYMSPEQVRGTQLDHRTDLYSMGVIMYETLTGELPFIADTVGDLIVKIATQLPPPVAKLRPELGPGLSDFVARTMSRDRNQRFADAMETKLALQTLTIDAADLFTVVVPGSHPDTEEGLDSSELMPASGSIPPLRGRGATPLPRRLPPFEDPPLGETCPEIESSAHPQAPPADPEADTLTDQKLPDPEADTLAEEITPVTVESQQSGAGRWLIIAALALVLLGGIATGLFFGLDDGSEAAGPQQEAATTAPATEPASPQPPTTAPEETADETPPAPEAVAQTEADRDAGGADSGAGERPTATAGQTEPQDATEHHSETKRPRRQRPRSRPQQAPRAFRDPGF